MNPPLSGVRVLDLSQMLAGPFGSMILADLGAEVIKIEKPGEGDIGRGMPPHFFHGESVYFLSVNRNKKSLTLNLKAKEGLEIFYRLVKVSDVVFDNFRPGVVEKLRIDYETLKKINPRIISCSVSGYGQTGPFKDRPGLRPDHPGPGRDHELHGGAGPACRSAWGPPREIWPGGSTPPTGSWPRFTSARKPAGAAHRHQPSGQPALPSDLPGALLPLCGRGGPAGGLRPCFGQSHPGLQDQDLRHRHRRQHGQILPGAVRDWAVRSWPPTPGFSPGPTG